MATTTTSPPPITFTFSSEVPVPSSLRMQTNGDEGSLTAETMSVKQLEPVVTTMIAPRHKKYYITDRLSIFLVDGQLFKVHRYQLEQESIVFRDMFESPPSAQGIEGETDENPIVLPDSLLEFEALLDFLYSRMHDDFSSFGVARWIDLLIITSKYQFDKIRARAIAELSKVENELDPVDEILLSQKCNVPQWILPALTKLVLRADIPSNADAARLSFDLLMYLWQAREKFKVAEAALRPSSSNSSFSFNPAASSPGSLFANGSSATTTVQTSTPARRAASVVQTCLKDSGYLPKGALPIAQIQFPV